MAKPPQPPHTLSSFISVLTPLPGTRVPSHFLCVCHSLSPVRPAPPHQPPCLLCAPRLAGLASTPPGPGSPHSELRRNPGVPPARLRLPPRRRLRPLPRPRAGSPRRGSLRRRLSSPQPPPLAALPGPASGPSALTLPNRGALQRQPHSLLGVQGAQAGAGGNLGLRETGREEPGAGARGPHRPDQQDRTG